jgi:hypothetical protein
VIRDADAGDRAISTHADIDGLRARIPTLAAELGMPGEPGYLEAAERFVATGLELLGAEEQAREGRRTRRRRRTKAAAVVSGTVLGLESIGLGAACLAGVSSPYWLLLLVPMVLFAGIMLSSGMDSDTDQDYMSRWPAIITALGADATIALVVNHVIAGGFSALAVALTVFATGAFTPDAKKPTDEGADELEAGSAEDPDSAVNDAVPNELPVSPPSDTPLAADPDRNRQGGGLVRQVRSLEGQIASLSSVIARAGLAPGADLELVAEDDDLLVSAILRGREARNTLLPVSERSARLAVLNEAGQSKLDYEDSLVRAVKATELLARTRAKGTAYAAASTGLREANAELEHAKLAYTGITARAERCVEELKADDRAAEKIAAVRYAGEDAYRELLDRFAVRLRGEIGRGALLPAWLISAVGPTPPLDSPGPWYDAAARVLAYRAVYGVHLDDSVLGPRPLASDHVRLAEFDELEETLRLRGWDE